MPSALVTLLMAVFIANFLNPALVVLLVAVLMATGLLAINLMAPAFVNGYAPQPHGTCAHGSSYLRLPS